MMIEELGVIRFKNGKIEIEVRNDAELFAKLEKITEGRITWMKHDLKILVIPETKVVVISTDTSQDVIDEYCALRS